MESTRNGKGLSRLNEGKIIKGANSNLGLWYKLQMNNLFKKQNL